MQPPVTLFNRLGSGTSQPPEASGTQLRGELTLQGALSQLMRHNNRWDTPRFGSCVVVWACPKGWTTAA